MSSNVAQQRGTTRDHVIRSLANMSDVLVGMLPPDLPLERFQSNVFQALQSNPAILDCTPASIVQSCMKAAYDGLRLDGREAALVMHEVTVGRNTAQQRKMKVAQYFPMVFGLIQQVYRGGEIASMVSEVVREGDEFDFAKGTNPFIHHKPALTNKLTPIIAAYSIATFRSGAVTFEILNRADLDDIKASAKTKKVWDRWEGEMSKKSAVRRHRKMLPIGNRDVVIRDSEEADLAGEAAPALGYQPSTSLPAAKPTRQAIEAQVGSEAGADLDLGEDADEDGVVIDQPKVNAKQSGVVMVESEEASTTSDAGAPDLPENEEAWRIWSTGLQDEIAKAESADAVNAISLREETRLNAATDERATFIRSLISDRLLDFATGEK